MERKTVRQLRQERGWTQLEVAYRVRASMSTIVNLETGKHQPRMDLAQRLAELFEVPLDAIAWGKSAT